MADPLYPVQQAHAAAASALRCCPWAWSSAPPAVPMTVRRERAAHLRAAGRATLHRFMVRQVGQTISLLTETEHSGHSEHFASVRLAAPSRPGAVMRARVVGSSLMTVRSQCDTSEWKFVRE